MSVAERAEAEIALGAEIARVRRKRGMSASAVAEVAEVSPQTVLNIEEGRGGYWSSVTRVVRALGGTVKVKWPR